MNDGPIPLSQLTEPRFSRIPTLLNAPHHTDLDRVDVALVGAPSEFTLNENGTRHGPAQLRQVSTMVRPVNGETLVNPHRLCRVVDVGDAPVNPLNLRSTNALLREHYEKLVARGIRTVSVGGDHGVSLPILRALGSVSPPLGMLQIDSHHDTHGAIFGEPDNHASFLRRVIEEGIVDPKRVFQVGIRGTLYAADDLDWARAQGIRVVRAEEFFARDLEDTIAEMLAVVGDGPLYVTLDTDGLDPTIAPGTGVPEPGGLGFRDCKALIQALAGKDVVGADATELAPSLDPTGGTARIVANLLFEELCLVADSKARELWAASGDDGAADRGARAAADRSQSRQGA